MHGLKADGYYYFLGLEPAAWLDKTVKVPKVSRLTLEQWVAEYERLKKVNEGILQGKVAEEPASLTLCIFSEPRAQAIGRCDLYRIETNVLLSNLIHAAESYLGRGR
jgi:hypothetical protein